MYAISLGYEGQARAATSTLVQTGGHWGSWREGHGCTMISRRVRGRRQVTSPGSRIGMLDQVGAVAPEHGWRTLS